MKSIINKSSLKFLESYLNNASPTGYEAEGQKIWMNYLNKYVDNFITDLYGTAVGVINSKINLELLSKLIQTKSHGTLITFQRRD